ncbi:unnamed protein product [Pleuronectes platessa]|uniref:Uncharacterized protein n=1 Tax=Pleuronectes platessa TaxID=8262 RepID=A0A9N7VT47_PLEPL|nr:unnamed protein product [Pleuronectes platessa]
MGQETLQQRCPPLCLLWRSSSCYMAMYSSATRTSALLACSLYRTVSAPVPLPVAALLLLLNLRSNQQTAIRCTDYSPGTRFCLALGTNVSRDWLQPPHNP